MSARRGINDGLTYIRAPWDEREMRSRSSYDVCPAAETRDLRTLYVRIYACVCVYARMRTGRAPASDVALHMHAAGRSALRPLPTGGDWF